jgi:hypothetical protein
MTEIESELELRHAYEAVARMYDLRDRVKADTTGDPETRDDQVEGIEMMIRKIERQIATYLTTHADKAA